MNEILLIIELILIYGSILVFYKLFGKSGLYAFTVFATLTANIEVMILVNAFGIEQTLGNILFAATFVVTDILSESEGKKSASKAVFIGIATSVLFIPLSQLWLKFIPASSDVVMPHIVGVFKNTPRLMLSSIAVYAIVQLFDVFLYHFIWDKTTKIWGDRKKFLWLRNNLATLMSQLLNSILFNFAAFYGVYPIKTIFSIIVSGYAIFIVTSLLDTPIVYIARRLNIKK